MKIATHLGALDVVFIGVGDAGTERVHTPPPNNPQVDGIPNAQQRKLGAQITYDVDNSKTLKAPFGRVAYSLELMPNGATEPHYVFASMDAFTTDLGKIGIPTLASKAHFHQTVQNLQVFSNVAGVQTSSNVVGVIEFWPNNYGPGNAAGITNASDQIHDFGDGPAEPVDGYGCMQVHNHEAKQTIFAINQWKGGASADVGIGNSTGRTRDWTFTSNAAEYEVKRLRVLVRPK